MTARRFRLSNGLGLIAALDRRAPIVALQTWYRVGSLLAVIPLAGAQNALAVSG